MVRRRSYGRKADLALDLWVKLARAFGTMSRCSVENIRMSGLTPGQFGVLEALGHLGPMTLGTLSQKQLSSCGNTTVVVDNLERQGLVARKASEADRRVTFVELTPKGKRLFDDSFPHHATHITAAVAVLTQAEQEQLASLLKKLGLSLEPKRQYHFKTDKERLKRREQNA